jgi:hypothetical protein
MRPSSHLGEGLFCVSESGESKNLNRSLCYVVAMSATKLEKRIRVSAKLIVALKKRGRKDQTCEDVIYEMMIGK